MQAAACGNRAAHALLRHGYYITQFPTSPQSLFLSASTMSVSFHPSVIAFPRMHSETSTLSSKAASHCFSGPLTRNVKSALTITNNDDQPVAFKVKTTAPKVCLPQHAFVHDSGSYRLYMAHRCIAYDRTGVG